MMYDTMARMAALTFIAVALAYVSSSMGFHHHHPATSSIRQQHVKHHHRRYQSLSFTKRNGRERVLHLFDSSDFSSSSFDSLISTDPLILSSSSSTLLLPISSTSDLVDLWMTQITALGEQGGPLVMTAAIAISDMLPLFPTQPISIVAGALFGATIGLPAVTLGQGLATLFAFWVGRYVLRRRRRHDDGTSNWWMSQMMIKGPKDNQQDSQDNGIDHQNQQQRMRQLDQVMTELTSGLNSNDPPTVFWTLFVARQSPILPFSLVNYFVGSATQAPLLPALLGSMVGGIPWNIVWVGAGAGGMVALERFQKTTTSGSTRDGVSHLLAVYPQVVQALEAVGVVATIVILVNVIQSIAKVMGVDESNEQ